MYSTSWPETMFWRQRKMNFENIFILPNVIGDRSRRRFGGIFIKIPKVTSAWSSLVGTHQQKGINAYEGLISQIKSFCVCATSIKVIACLPACWGIYCLVYVSMEILLQSKQDITN